MDPIKEVKDQVTQLNSKFDSLADKGLAAWQKKAYSAWIMVGVAVVLPLLGVVVGYVLCSSG